MKSAFSSAGHMLDNVMERTPPAPPLHRSVLLSIILGSRLLRQCKSKGVKIASHLGYLIVNHPLSLLWLEEKHLGPRLERLQHSDFGSVPSWSPCFMPNYSIPIKKKRLSPTPQYKLSPHSVEQTTSASCFTADAREGRDTVIPNLPQMSLSCSLLPSQI